MNITISDSPCYWMKVYDGVYEGPEGRYEFSIEDAIDEIRVQWLTPWKVGMDRKLAEEAILKQYRER